MTDDLRYLSRRDFLKKSVVAGAALTILPYAKVMGANADVRVAIVGAGNKGNQHMAVFKKLAGVRVVALCDPDSNRLQEAIDKHFSAAGEKPQTYTDIRKLLENKDIDAVVVATPNHWHALAAMWAMQAGKDVYTEKPFSHAFAEGQLLIAGAKKYGKVVQVGTQSRSDAGLQGAVQYVRDGHMGPLEYVRGIYYNLREPIGKVDGPQPPPPGVDYNLWLGPAPDAPLMRKNLHYDWHWQWPYGNGELGNNMVHMLDISMWFMDHHDFPNRVMSVGGRFGWDDDGQTPNTQTVFYDFGEGSVPVMCEVRNLPREAGAKDPDQIKGCHTGVQVKCRDGYFVGYNNGGWFYDNNGKRVKQFPGDGGGSHQQNFIDAIRAHDPSIVKAPPALGHVSAGLCHLANISHKLARPCKGADIYKAIGKNPSYDMVADEFQEHLLMNHVDVQGWPRQLGPWLEFDPAAQRFIGAQAEEANAHLTVPYRDGFELKV